MRIVIFEVEEWERKAFERLEKEHEIDYVNEMLTRENVKECVNAEVVSPFIYSNLSGDLLKHLSRLKLIATRSTGFDHIDLE